MHSRFTPLRVFSLSSPLSLHDIRARRRIETLIMVDSSSLPKVTKSEENKAIAIPHSTVPHPVGFHVPIKLTRENFPLWKTQLFPLLNYHDLAHILMQDLPISTQIADHDGITVNAAYQTWWHQDQQVLSLIVTSLSKSVLPYVVRKLTTKEAWSALMKHCSSTNPSRIMHLHNRLHNTQKGTRSIAKFVQDIQRTCDELAAAANSVQESVSTYALLHGLGSAYSTFSTGISSNLINLGFDDVVAQINSYEDLMKFSHPAKDITVSDFPPKANQTQITSSSRGRGCNNGRNNHGRGRNGGRYIPRFQLCGQFGHRILECRERFNKLFYGQQNSPPNHTNQDFPQAYNTNMQLPQVYTTNLQPVHTPQDHSAWYPDSGATHHVTNNAHNLINPKIYQGPDQLHVGNDTGLVIHSTGSSSLISRSLPLKLVNILHVPDIQKNLLSIFRLTNDNSVFVEFHATYCIVTDEITGRPLHRGTVKDGLYLLAQARPPEVNIGERIGVDLWHHHLRHPKMRLLQSVISTYGLPMLSVSKTLSCDACLSSKSHHLPYSKSTHQTSRALKIIHSDLWGPSPIISHLGNWYYVLFIDDFTRYTWLYPLKLKSNVLSVFTDFQLRVEKQFSQKILSLQSDWGGKFQGRSKHLTQQGISHRVSCSHTLAQNGTTERKHRHIVETTLSLLHHSSVPHKYWDEAVCTAVYLINRLPTSILHNRSPYQLVYHREPTYSLLKSFGCSCYPCLRPYASTKFDPRSEQCIFLGYSAVHLGYQCLSLTTGKIYISRDVVFQENDYPYKLPFLSPFNSNSFLGLLGPPPTQPSPPSGSASSSLNNNSTFFLPMNHPEPSSTPSIVTPPSTYSSLDTPQPDPPHTSHDNEPPSESLASPASLASSHLPSSNPLSPSNLDFRTSPSEVKTRRLSDVLRTVDLSKSPHSPKYPLPMCLLTSTTSSPEPEPTTFLSASQHPAWNATMSDELTALLQNQTWQLVPRPLHHPVIGCKWVYKTKPSLAGAPLRYKARLVAKGFHQEGGIDYHETFSPIIKTTTIRLLLALAISKQWHICQLDISNAFLHGDLTELIYMEQPPGFHHPHYPHHVCQLRKSLYGLKQAPREWFRKLTGRLLNLGFHGSKTNPSLYFLTTRPLYILIYVDNILILGPSLSPIHQLITSLKTHFRRKDLGPASRFLSIELHKHRDGFTLTQTHYTLSILHLLKMEHCKPLPTPSLATCPMTVRFRASLNHKNAGQTKFMKPNSQR